MTLFNVQYGFDLEVRNIEVGTPQGEQFIGEGHGEIVFQPMISISNEIGTFDENDSTINIGGKTTEGIITDLMYKYSKVWESLA